MAAITHPETHISEHADYRRSDYVFPRTQSRAFSQREWDHPTPALRSWSNLLIPTVTAAAAATVALAAFF
jgi:hypothetical protein